MLTRALDGYLAIRRAAGFELTVDAGLLRNFTRFATARADTHVRRQTAIAWAIAAPSPSQRERTGYFLHPRRCWAVKAT